MMMGWRGIRISKGDIRGVEPISAQLAQTGRNSKHLSPVLVQEHKLAWQPNMLSCFGQNFGPHLFGTNISRVGKGIFSCCVRFVVNWGVTNCDGVNVRPRSVFVAPIKSAP